MDRLAPRRTPLERNFAGQPSPLGESIRFLRDDGLIDSSDRKHHRIVPLDNIPHEATPHTIVVIFGEEYRNVRGVTPEVRHIKTEVPQVGFVLGLGWIVG
jgi:hypothetical protein